MAMHTQNLQADPRASLLVTQNDAGGDPLGASRVTLVGNVLPMPESEVPEARKLYLQRYVNSKYWVDFEDFSFYRMDVVDVYYVGGFGVMGWVSASEYDPQPTRPSC
jgi:heme iron utilization protein